MDSEKQEKYLIPDLGPHQPTLIADLPEDAYHAHGAVSKSRLDTFRRSPFHYWSEYLSGQAPPREESAAFRFGSAFHAAVLEPGLFEEDYVRTSYRTRTLKAYREEEEEHPGRTLLTESEGWMIDGMLESIHSHARAAELLLDAGGNPELSAFAYYEGAEMNLRGRFDMFRSDGNRAQIIDLKTCQDASPRGFEKSVRQWGYHRQAAMYSMLAKLCGFEHVDFIFVAVDKKPPFATGVYTLSASDEERGWDEVFRSLQALRQCMDEDKWPSYAGGQQHQLTAFQYA